MRLWNDKAKLRVTRFVQQISSVIFFNTIHRFKVGERERPFGNVKYCNSCFSACERLQRDSQERGSVLFPRPLNFSSLSVSILLWDFDSLILSVEDPKDTVFSKTFCMLSRGKNCTYPEMKSSKQSDLKEAREVLRSEAQRSSFDRSLEDRYSYYIY